MAQRTQLDEVSSPLHDAYAYACLLANGLDGVGEALRISTQEMLVVNQFRYGAGQDYSLQPAQGTPSLESVSHRRLSTITRT